MDDPRGALVFWVGDRALIGPEHGAQMDEAKEPEATALAGQGADPH